MAQNMKAAVMRQHGGPEALSVEEVARPVPGAGEVLVKVAACSLSRLDIFIRDGMPGRVIRMPHVGGCDVAGWIEAIGPEVSGLRTGAPVLIDPFWNGEIVSMSDDNRPRSVSAEGRARGASLRTSGECLPWRDAG